MGYRFSLVSSALFGCFWGCFWNTIGHRFSLEYLIFAYVRLNVREDTITHKRNKTNTLAIVSCMPSPLIPPPPAAAPSFLSIQAMRLSSRKRQRFSLYNSPLTRYPLFLFFIFHVHFHTCLGAIGGADCRYCRLERHRAAAAHLIWRTSTRVGF